MDDKDSPVQKEETKSKAPEANDEKGKNPFGEHVKPAMYILFDETKQSFFVLGAPGFLDDPVRAYGALKIAEKNLDDFYLKKRSLRDSLTSGVRNFQNKMQFRRFLNNGR